MTMNTAQPLPPVSIPASGDLSATVYRFADIDTDGEIVNASAGGRVVGVRTNKPAAQGRPASLTVAGIELVEVGGSVTPGPVKSDSVGRAVAASADDVAAGLARGIAMGTASSGYVPVYLFPSPTIVAASGVEVLDAPGTVSASTGLTLLEIDGTDPHTIEDGLYDGQIKEILVVSAANSPSSVVTGKFREGTTARTTATFNAAADYLRAAWVVEEDAWQVLVATSVTMG